MLQDASEVKKRFAQRLTKLLKQRYNGRIPSLSVVARDLSLWAPHLPHVSSEAVRKWLRGNAIPQSPRMQSLVDWLGEELLEPLEEINGAAKPYLTQVAIGTNGPPSQNLLALIESLQPSDLRLVIKLIRSLAEKSTRRNQPG